MTARRGVQWAGLTLLVIPALVVSTVAAVFAARTKSS